jgi:hypothetical protein
MLVGVLTSQSDFIAQEPRGETSNITGAGNGGDGTHDHCVSPKIPPAGSVTAPGVGSGSKTGDQRHTIGSEGRCLRRVERWYVFSTG